MPPLVLCLMGPTASGKTALAIELAKELPCELISVDSAMVYRGLNIGTAKPDAALQALAPHRLLDLRDPSESYSAGDFKRDALREIDSVLQQGKIPLLVGGTMLYFRTLQGGLDDLPTQDPVLRAALQQEGDKQGWPALHEQLAQVDPEAAARIHPHDSQRIQRALEVYRLTGKALSQQQKQARELPYQFLSLVLCPSDRSVLHQRIEQRFSAMLEAGFVEEVRTLYQRPELSLEKPALRSVGYRQVWEYLAGNYGYEEMQEKALAATRQFAKRQLTWLRKWEGAQWFDSEELTVREEVLSYVLRKVTAK